MIKGHSWAGIAASLVALAWWGLPTTATAQEESGMFSLPGANCPGRLA
jgi:hypothetical protein